MDFTDIFEEIIGNITGVEGTNETTEGLWFATGIKKNTGETFYWSTVGDPIEGNIYPISFLGSIIDVPIGHYTEESSGSYEMNRVPAFIAHSKTAVYIEPDPFALSRDLNYNTYDNPPIYKATHYEIQHPPYSDSWTSANNIRSRAPRYYTRLYDWIESESEYGPANLLYTATTGGSFDFIPNFVSGGQLPNWYWQHSDFMSGGPSSISRIFRPYMYTVNRGGDIYIQCIAVRDDDNQSIKIMPYYKGFSIWVTDYLNDEYTVDCVSDYKNSYIAKIDYSTLNNTTYFDPIEDAGEDRPDPDDPDFNNDTSGTGGGKGTYRNYPSDDIGLPALPTVGAIDSGFLTMYNPNNSQLQSLVNYLWTSDWLDTIKKMISNPMDAIISLQLAPYDIGTIVTSHCKIGAVDTNISMPKVSNQYKVLNCGTVSIPEHWGNALDYNNVNISIYLPYVGVRKLDTNLCMNSTLGLAYYVDMLTGSAIAMLLVNKTDSSKSVYYTFDCNLNYQIPVTGANYAETIKALFSVGASAVGAGMSLSSGNVSGALGATASMVGSAYMAGSGANHYESSGSLSANTGILGQFQPYVVVELPKQSLPKNFNHLKGYTSNIYSRIGDLTGYTVVESVHVDNIPGATDREKQMIESLLMEGVIV